MPNFDAILRLDYRDVAGLVLDCQNGGLELDGSSWTNSAPPRRTTRTGTHGGLSNSGTLSDTTRNWIPDGLVGAIVYNVTDGSFGEITANTADTVTATLAGGSENDWDLGDEYRIATPRFGCPVQATASKRPTVTTVSGIRQAQFDLSNSQYFQIPLDDSFGLGSWTVAFDYIKDGTTTNNQTVFGAPNLEIIRRNGSGNFAYRHNAVTVNGSGDLDTGTWLFQLDGALNTGEMFQNGISQLSGSGSSVAIDAASAAAFIGSADGSSDFSDMIVRSFQIWNVRLSARERDFILKTVSPEFDVSQYDRATMLNRSWSDDTGDELLNQASRINPTRNAAQYFRLAQFPAGTKRLVQVAASVGGRVRPDSELGGDLFDLVPIEYPGAIPRVDQDSGWSSVFDITIEAEGHYTFAVHRINGGTIILHLDAEEV